MEEIRLTNVPIPLKEALRLGAVLAHLSIQGYVISLLQVAVSQDAALQAHLSLKKGE